MRHLLNLKQIRNALVLAILIWPLQIQGAGRTEIGIVADETRRTVVARVKSGITVDGAIDETDWQGAQPIGEILQREPRPGEKATELTEVKILHDNQNLYIGVVCYDSEPDRIIGTQMARDAGLFDDDRIEILIDTFHDRRNAFYFATNPLGALVDGLIIENDDLNRDWDAIWIVRTQRFDRGWSAEFSIPFKSLSFNKGQAVWGFNFSRTIKRKLEEDRWAAPRLDVDFFQVSEAGEISGFSEVEQGLGLDVRPFVSGKWLRSGETGDNLVKGKPGADVFYNLTPSLKLTATFNTDFAETEVDNRQINLTRFPLFFPEKRAFFLENAGVFNFSNLNSGDRDALPFFSRRIGLLRGQEVPIDAGIKLTGKVGPYDIGLLDVRTGQTDFVEAKNFFVGRVKRNLFTQSYIGGIFTDGNPAGPSSSRTYGADARFATSNFLGRDRNFSVEGFALRSDNESIKSDNAAYGFTISYPNDLWDIDFSLRQIERNYRPALGFVPRADIRKLSFSADFSPRPKNFLNIRQMFHEFRYTQFTRLDKGQVESWRLFTAPVNYQLNSGDRFEFNYVPTFERLFEPFEIADGVILPVGDYRFTRWRAEFDTASKRAWRVEATWWFGTYWSGRSDDVEVSFEYKLAPHFQVGIEAEQTFARLAEGNFVARVFGLRANYSVSPFLTFSNLVQFDNESRDLGWQARMRWILRPGNDIFVVFNQGWIQDERGGFNFRSADTSLAAKIQYTFRF